jgi:hypothetical protein
MEDGFSQIGRMDPDRVKGRLRIQYVNEAGLPEAGIDGGGLFKDFMEELLRQGFSPQVGSRGFYMGLTVGCARGLQPTGGDQGASSLIGSGGKGGVSRGLKPAGGGPDGLIRGCGWAVQEGCTFGFNPCRHGEVSASEPGGSSAARPMGSLKTSSTALVVAFASAIAEAPLLPCLCKSVPKFV